jgi:hypothetical protein
MRKTNNNLYQWPNKRGLKIPETQNENPIKTHLLTRKRKETKTSLPTKPIHISCPYGPTNISINERAMRKL